VQSSRLLIGQHFEKCLGSLCAKHACREGAIGSGACESNIRGQHIWGHLSEDIKVGLNGPSISSGNWSGEALIPHAQGVI
jgi:hypothetical protein